MAPAIVTPARFVLPIAIKPPLDEPEIGACGPDGPFPVNER